MQLNLGEINFSMVSNCGASNAENLLPKSLLVELYTYRTKICGVIGITGTNTSSLELTIMLM